MISENSHKFNIMSLIRNVRHCTSSSMSTMAALAVNVSLNIRQRQNRLALHLGLGLSREISKHNLVRSCETYNDWKRGYRVFGTHPVNTVLLNFFPVVASTEMKQYSTLVTPYNSSCFHHRNYRTLYQSQDADFLGLLRYERIREITISRLEHVRDTYFEQLDKYMRDGDSVVFSEDLKQVLYIAETDEELQVAVKLLKKFIDQKQQNTALIDFSFGPVVMRLLYYLKKPALAFNLYTDKAFRDLFDGDMARLILIDLLLETKYYLKIFDIVDAALKYNTYVPSRRVVTIYIAACYFENTKESLQKAMDILHKLSFDILTYKSVNFYAMLCVNQGMYEHALETMKLKRASNNVAINVKILALLGLTRLDDVVEILENLILQPPGQASRNILLAEDVKEKIQETIRIHEGLIDLPNGPRTLSSLQQALNECINEGLVLACCLHNFLAPTGVLPEEKWEGNSTSV